MHFLALVLLAIGLVSCSKDESLPPVRNSAELVMNGSHYVSLSGAPDEITFIQVDSTPFPGGFSTSPVPLIGGGFIIGTKRGRILVFDSKDSLDHTIDLRIGASIDQLLLDSNSIFAIYADHSITSSDIKGQMKWSITVDTTLTASAILAGSLLVVPNSKGIDAFDGVNGRRTWHFPSMLEIHSIAYGSKNQNLIVALSSNAFDRNDTISRLSMDGRLLQSFPIGGRITSNLALCGVDETEMAVGIASGSGAGKRLSVQLIDASGKQLQSHVLPYFVNSVGANSEHYFTSGFRNSTSENVSGVDAFSLVDTTSLWSRRFSAPVVNPIAVGDGSLYFSLTFETQAIVAARGLFYTLDAGNGKTLSERAMAGSIDGFVPGMPMPDESGRLLLADRARPVVYILNRSAFHRIF